MHFELIITSCMQPNVFLFYFLIFVGICFSNRISFSNLVSIYLIKLLEKNPPIPVIFVQVTAQYWLQHYHKLHYHRFIICRHHKVSSEDAGGNKVIEIPPNIVLILQDNITNQSSN